MSRYIDADEFGRCLRNYRPYVDSGRFNAIQTEVNQVLDCIEYEIEDAPSIDIVRCKECASYCGNGNKCLWGLLTGDMGYCHHGYRGGDCIAKQTEREGE